MEKNVFDNAQSIISEIVAEIGELVSQINECTELEEVDGIVPEQEKNCLIMKLCTLAQHYSIRDDNDDRIEKLEKEVEKEKNSSTYWWRKCDKQDEYKKKSELLTTALSNILQAMELGKNE